MNRNGVVDTRQYRPEEVIEPGYYWRKKEHNADIVLVSMGERAVYKPREPQIPENIEEYVPVLLCEGYWMRSDWNADFMVKVAKPSVWPEQVKCAWED